MSPDALGIGRGFLYHGGTAYAGLIAANYRKYLDPTDIAAGKATLTGADVGQFAALTSRHDHELELLGTQGPAAGQPALAATARDGWRLATAGDFDGDGQSDLFWRQDTGATFMELRHGAAVVNAAGFGPVEASWQLAPSGDFDGDGRADLLWHHDGGDTYLWLMDGLTLRATHDFGVVGAAWHIAGVGDLNGDGRADILWRHADGQLYGWLMEGAGIAGQGMVSAQAGTDWQVAGMGDFNGDGRADILFHGAPG